jgi:hypothetical protein
MAELYLHACISDPRRPAPALAEELGIGVKRVREFVHKARMRGLLEGGKQGSSGGQLSERSRQLLRRRDPHLIVTEALEG